MHMRTTLDFNSPLLREAKKRAADEGRSLTRVLEDALRRYLLGSQRAKSNYRFRPYLKNDMRLRPGVDVNDRAAMAKLLGDLD